MNQMDILLGDFSKSSHVSHARELVPVLRERAARQWQESAVFQETIDDLQGSGLFGMMQPRRWGGSEAHLSEFYESVMTIAEADPSVAWVLSVVGVHSFHLAQFDERAQEEVWGSDSSMLIGSPYSPNGTAEIVDGGYVLNGHWKFSSGSKHCGWTFLGGVVKDGSTPDPSLRYQRNQLAFLLPRSDYEIVENWDVHGLRASGSHDIVVKNAFVPAHRTLSFIALQENKTPGQRVNTSPLYRHSFFQVFPRATSAPIAVGALKGMADQVVHYGLQRSKTAVVRAGVGNTAQDPAVALAVARALSAVDEMKASIHRSFVQLAQWVDEGVEGDLHTRRRYRYETAAGPARCAELASELFRVCGGSGVSRDLPFGRLLNDILAVRSHITNNFQPHANAWVFAQMGQDVAGWPV